MGPQKMNEGPQFFTRCFFARRREKNHAQVAITSAKQNTAFLSKPFEIRTVLSESGLFTRWLVRHPVGPGGEMHYEQGLVFLFRECRCSGQAKPQQQQNQDLEFHEEVSSRQTNQRNWLSLLPRRL